MGKKKVLTEDLFNAYGNANVSDIVNEMKEDIEDKTINLTESVNNDNVVKDTLETIVSEDVKDENKETIDEIKDSMMADFDKNKENSEKLDEIKETLEETITNTTDENKENIEKVSETVEPIIKTVNKKIGFNDESYYYDAQN